MALKVLNRSWSHDAKVTAQFEREATLTARVNHPNVVRVYSSGISHGIFYIAMELVTHGSLEKWMAQSGRLPEAAVLRAGIQIAEGLQSAQRAGLIHRDIKPANILFAENNLPKIVDFGLALHSSESKLKESDSEIWGTPDYIAPESLESKTEDSRSDMYALAATLWHALAGTPPHKVQTNSIRQLLEIKSAPLNLAHTLPNLHNGTIHALTRALAFRPEDRHPDYQSFISDLEKALRDVQPDTPIAKRALALGPFSIWKSAALGLSITATIIGTLAWKNRHQTFSTPHASSEHSITEESRLISANTLIASGRLADAAPILEKIIRVPDLSPKTAALSRLSLACLYAVDGKNDRRAVHLKQLSNVSIPNDPTFAAFLQKLPGIAASPLQTRDTSPARAAVQNLCESLTQLSKKNWLAAKTAVDAAAAQDPNAWTESEIAALIPLSKWIQTDLEIFLKIKQHLASQAASETPKEPSTEPILKAESLTRILTLVAPLRSEALAAIQSAKSEQAKLATQTHPAPLPAPKTEPSPQINESSKLDPQAVARFEKLNRDTSELVNQFKFQAALKKVEDFTGDFPSQAKLANKLILSIKASAFLFDWAIREINSGTTLFPQPMLRSGAPFPASPLKANTERVILRTENGSTTPMSWTQIAPGYLLSIANIKLSSTTAPIPRAEILWMAGNFQILAGSQEKGMATLRQAAELNPAYIEGLKALLEP